MIAVFDSGMGGLSVFCEVARLLPSAPLTYFADTAHLPYGERSDAEIIAYTAAAADRLVEEGAKLLVLACYTASAIALSSLQEQLPIPVKGMVEPLTSQVVALSFGARVALLATAATVRSGIIEEELLRLRPDLQICSFACPTFVSLVESGHLTGEDAKRIVKEALAPLKKEHVEALFLGCTHYTALLPLIAREMGDVVIIDGTSAVARQVAARYAACCS